MKKFLILNILIFIFIGMDVKASTVYYSNENVSLSEKEYNYIIQLYGKEYLEKMSFEDYLWLKELDIDNSMVEISFSEENLILPTNVIITTTDQKLAISKSCQSSYCIVTLISTWLNNPTIRSYDVMGFRFNGTSLYNNNVTTRLSSSNGIETISNYRFLDNGFGNSIKLPNSGNNFLIEQRAYVKTGGTVYGTYQHATKNVTLNISKNYYISMTGYGSVFTFTGNAINVYNGLTGVHISV